MIIVLLDGLRLGKLDTKYRNWNGAPKQLTVYTPVYISWLNERAQYMYQSRHNCGIPI